MTIVTSETNDSRDERRTTMTIVMSETNDARDEGRWRSLRRNERLATKDDDTTLATKDDDATLATKDDDDRYDEGR
jgi:hypothetical protein